MVLLNGHVLKWWLVFGLLACGSVHAVAQESKWVSIGPASIETGSGNWWNGSGFGTGPVTGRVADIAVDPSNPAHWLIGGGYGGVWETTDMGRTWAPRSDDAPTQAMGVIAFAPSNPQIVYAGTGEGGSGFNCAGAGLLRSTDGGTTWLHRTPQLTNQSFSDLLVDPKDPNHLVAATSWGYMCGRVGGWLGGKSSQFAPTPGLWASRNGGLPVGFPNGFVRVMEGWATDLEVDPGDFQRQYAGIGNPYGKDPRNGVFRSFDGGDTWTEVVSDTTTWKECPPARCPGYMNPNVKPGGQGRVELAIAPSNPNVLYAIIQDALDNNGNDAQILGIWRTTNAWDTYPVWQEIPLPLNWVGSLGRQTEYDLAIIVDPTDENIIYVGGTDLYRFSQGSWAKVAGYSMERIHVDIQSMAWAGSRLLVTSDGGVFSTQDSGNTWGNHNNGLTLTQFTHGSVHPTDSSIVMGGSQDNGSEIGTGQPLVWRLVYGGDGGDNAISPTRPTTHWAGSAQNLAIFRTTDGGSNVSDATSGIDRSGVDEGLDKPFEKCPANEDVFIAGNDRLWRTSNFFSAPAPQWVDNGPSATIGERNISALAFAFSDRSCGTYAFSRWDGAIYLTTSSGTNWKRIDQPCNGCITTVLAFQPNNPDIVYAANFPPGFKVTLNPEAPLIFTGPILYKTVNATSSTPIWSDISPPARTGLNTMIIDSRNPATVYVGDGRDVWRSTDGGLNWVSIGGPTNGLPRVFISDLQINASGQLFAFTFGRGAYRLETGNVPDSAAISAVLPANASKTESLLVAGIGVIVLVGRRRMQWHSGTAP